MSWPGGLDIRLEHGGDKPLHAQLAEAILAAAADGRLQPGTRLPSIRAAAAELGINPGTVSTAYGTLVRMGHLVARAGSGYRTPARVRAVEVADVPDLADELYSLEDIEWMGGTRSGTAAAMVNMASSTPEPDLQTQADVRDAFTHVLTHALREAFDYQEPMGFPPLRAILAESLGLEGVHTDPGCIQIISGAQQGLDIVAKAMLSPGDTVLVEYPTYPGAVAVFRSRGVRVVGVPVGPDGMDPDQVRDMMRRYRPRLIYVIPFHQNPTGVVYTPERLQSLVRIADAFGAFVVEDDYLRELRFDGCVPRPLKAFDDADRVIFVKSHSKLLMPGLRVAHMVVPQARSARLALAKHTTDIFTSGLLQQGFHEFCLTGGWTRHLDRMRQAQGMRCRELGLRLAASLPDDVPVPTITGGLSYWLELPDWADPEALYRLCGAQGVRIVPDTLFLDEGLRAAQPADWRERRHVRVSFAALGKEDARIGAEVLGGCLAQMRSTAWRQVRWKTT